MLKRSLFFSNPSNLVLRNDQLVICEKNTNDVISTVPIEDLGYVIIENLQVSVTLPLLESLSKNNVAVVFCDSAHMPMSMLQNLDANNTQAEVYKEQILASDSFKKKLWKNIVEVKIKNQASVLNKLGKEGDVLKPLYMNVKVGDSDNREGVAARLYWGMLFGGDFERMRDGYAPNNMLNYGYTILRAATARALMGSGLFPAFGLFHRNRYNAFPLADDIMEPYRPYVDDLVYEMYSSGKRELTKDVKAEIIKILYSDTLLNGVRKPLQMSLSSTTASLARCFASVQKHIDYPLII